MKKLSYKILSVAVLALATFSSVEASAWCETRYVRCESIGHRYNRCDIADGWHREVRGGYIVRQHSKAPCGGWSARITRTGVEVDRGCRATFALDVCQRWQGPGKSLN